MSDVRTSGGELKGYREVKYTSKMEELVGQRLMAKKHSTDFPDSVGQRLLNVSV